jgi:hypothetical protein
MLRATTLLLCLVGSVTVARAAPDPQPDAPGIDKTELRRALGEERAMHLARFDEYRKKRVYPHNTYEPGMLNVWRDADDHLCAIATLVHLDGKDDVVDAIAKGDNFVKTADLTDGPVMDWMLTSGFTQEEVVMIQQPSAADVEQMEREYRAEERRKKRALAREDNRLAKVYKTVEKTLTSPRIADAGLDLATARLAQHPDLAKALLAKHPAPAVTR